MKQKTQKGDPVFDLLKVPDSVIVKEQAIEIGKLKSYIQELELKEESHLQKIIANKNNFIAGLQEKIRKQKLEIYNLRYENANRK